MSWWNPFSTEAGNGKTSEQLDAEAAELDRQRAARKKAEADYLESEGFSSSAAELRDREEAWQREHKQNLQRQDAALLETPGQAFAAEWYAGTERLAGATGSAIGHTIKTIFKSVHWSIWLGLILIGAWKLGLLDKLWKRITS
jgi:hypothetical protein